MPIKYVKGDLFSTDIRCIAHGCNTAGVMGSGVAAIWKKKFPQSFKDYVARCKYDPTIVDNPLEVHFRAALLGQTVVTEEQDKKLFCMFTQGDWSRAFGSDKRYVSYDAVSECFDSANIYIGTYEEDKRLAIPMIGAGLGGGDWDIIEKIIEKSTPNIEVTVYQL